MIYTNNNNGEPSKGLFKEQEISMCSLLYYSFLPLLIFGFKDTFCSKRTDFFL